MKLFNVARKYGSKAATKVAAVGTALTVAAGSAMAQAADGPFDQFLDAIGLGTTSGKVIAIGLLIVGIALAFKGPDLAKRVIRKV